MLGLSVVNNSRKCVIAIMGPTATGKTDVAAALGKYVNGEIISVDSSLVYKGMDIGTAKPDKDFLQQYPHHLVDIREPNQHYSVADFYHDALPIVNRIIEQGKTPILVGGTLFYFHALENGLPQLPESNASVRAFLLQQGKELGWQKMHQKLQALDAKRAANINPNDAQRIQRALEVITLSGQKVASLSKQQQPGLAYPMVKLILSYSDRHFLHQRIEQRFDIMLESGFQKEVEVLLEKGFDEDCLAMKMIGYRQMLEYLRGDLNYEQMRQKGIVATRQLAKRQYTWLRNSSNNIWWVDSGLKQKKFEHLCEFLTQFI